MMLEKLDEVQTYDLQIDAIKQEQKQTPDELIAMQKQQETLKGNLQEREHQYAEIRQRVNESEMELGVLTERRKNAAAAALEAQSAKEASQYQNQELQFATRIQELEEDTMPLMERAENLANAVEELKQQLGEITPAVEQLLLEEEARVADLKAKAQELTEKRNVLAKEISAPLLKQYEQVRRAKRGIGLVKVVDNQRCGGCNVKLPIHVVQKAKKGTSVTRCPNCGRILWAQE